MQGGTDGPNGPDPKREILRSPHQEGKWEGRKRKGKSWRRKIRRESKGKGKREEGKDFKKTEYRASINRGKRQSPTGFDLKNKPQCFSSLGSNAADHISVSKWVKSKWQVTQQMPAPVRGHRLPPSPPQTRKITALRHRLPQQARQGLSFGATKVASRQSVLHLLHPRGSGPSIRAGSTVPSAPGHPVTDGDCGTRGVTARKKWKKNWRGSWWFRKAVPTGFVGWIQITARRHWAKQGKEQEIKAAQLHASELLAWSNETRQN